MIITRLFLGVVLTLIITCNGYPQRIEVLHSGTGVSLRGLSVVSQKTIWASGSNGTVGISTNGGKTWRFFVVPGYESRDFRDIEAFDASTAILLAVGEPAIILKTTNGGKSWLKVYENKSPGMFLDAMEFWNKKYGFVIGDPVKARFFVARTIDGGSKWQDIPFDKRPLADSGEACFAASGTNVRALDKNQACFVSGGSRSRLFWKGAAITLPILQGRETQGANSVSIWQNGNNAHHIIITGGDFKADSLRIGNCTLSRDGGKTWIRPFNPPYGYRSCVEFISATRVITCGITGVDLSLDEGINWNNISAIGFHVCRKSKKGDAVFLAGEDGRIGKIIF